MNFGKYSAVIGANGQDGFLMIRYLLKNNIKTLAIIHKNNEKLIKIKNKNLKIIKIRLINNKELDELNFDKERINKDESSKVLKIYKNEGVVISTNTTPIVILEIKLEGKNASSNNQLIQQLNLKIGDKI